MLGSPNEFWWLSTVNVTSYQQVTKTRYEIPLRRVARDFSSLFARKNFDFAQDDIQWGYYSIVVCFGKFVLSVELRPISLGLSRRNAHHLLVLTEERGVVAKLIFGANVSGGHTACKVGLCGKEFFLRDVFFKSNMHLLRKNVLYVRFGKHHFPRQKVGIDRFLQIFGNQFEHRFHQGVACRFHGGGAVQPITAKDEQFTQERAANKRKILGRVGFVIEVEQAEESAKVGVLSNVENGGLCKQFLAVLYGNDIWRKVEHVVLIRVGRARNKVVISRLRNDQQIIRLWAMQYAVNVKVCVSLHKQKQLTTGVRVLGILRLARALDVFVRNFKNRAF